MSRNILGLREKLPIFFRGANLIEVKALDIDAAAKRREITEADLNTFPDFNKPLENKGVLIINNLLTRLSTIAISSSIGLCLGTEQHAAMATLAFVFAISQLVFGIKHHLKIEVADAIGTFKNPAGYRLHLASQKREREKRRMKDKT